MRLPNGDFHQYLTENGISHLYHANTVATSITFIQQHGLLSRAAVEARGLYQTPQGSDQIDKHVDVWNDIFFDTDDLHGYFPRENRYGPVSFKFSIGFLLNERYSIWVTKNNPQYWTDGESMQDRYFQSVNELRETGAQYPRYHKMVLLKNMHDPLTFGHLVQISIDNPHVYIYTDILPWREYVKAFKNIQPIELIGKFHIRRVKVDCQQKCYCTDNYLRYPAQKLAKLFLPADHPRFKQ